MLRLTFYGAAGTVTGSKYLIETDKAKVLVDCGLFQGRKELRLRNWDKPGFDPNSLDAIVLTHAHIDHTGYLPLVVKRGYRGPIYCTNPTADLLSLLLPDSAHLQEEEAKFAERHGTSKHHPPKPLYSGEDAQAALRQVQIINRGSFNTLLPDFRVLPRCAGHILGATTLTVETAGRRITFSGDVGRYSAPILPDPKPVEFGDLLLCESTYGDREHEDSDPATELAAIVRESIARKGPLIIPAFALGRTQTLLYFLAGLERAGKIPVIPVYVDSPMAVDATHIYRRFKNDYDDEATALLKKGETPLLTERTIFCRLVDESKRLNSLTGPRIIISASGMITGGRVLHHMKHGLPDENATVLLVGYQADETRGRKLQEGAAELRLFGQDVPVRAEIKTMSGLSAHGDRSELLRWLKSSTGTPSTVRIVHGEPGPADAFSRTLTQEFGWKAQPARYLETVEVA